MERIGPIMETCSALTLEEVLTFASQEVSKAIIHEEKSNVIVCVEEITLASETAKAESPDGEKEFLLSSDEKLQNPFLVEESVFFADCDMKQGLSIEEMVRQLQAEVLALKKKRADEGRANEKVVSMFASREQAWKVEKRRFLSEQRRLWQELQRAFMEQEVLKQRSQHLSGVQEEFACEECEQREGWLNEMKERLREQEFVIMTSMAEAKAEQHEKNSIGVKFSKLEADFCEVSEKLRLESEAHARDVQKHEAALAEILESCKTLETEKSLALRDIECLQKTLADAQQEKRHYEDLVAEMSTEIHMLQVGAHEKEDVISAMLKKSDGDTEERYQLENELAIMKAKFLHVQSEKVKWHKYANDNSPCNDRELMKPRRSVGSKADSGFDNIRELQRLHDLEIRDLQSAFEEEVRLLKKRLSLFQERVSDLEENILLRMAKNVQITHNVKKKTSAFPLEVINGLSVFNSYVEEDMTAEQFQLSIAKSLLRQYMETDAQREQEIEKLKKAYFTSKTTIEMLHKERSHTVSSPRSRGLGDWLELERTRSKLEQRHLQEIKAFERQLKARDVRMEAFRQQLLSMEREAEERALEMETLKNDIKRASQENSLLKRRMVEDSGGGMT